MLSRCCIHALIMYVAGRQDWKKAEKKTPRNWIERESRRQKERMNYFEDEVLPCVFGLHQVFVA